MKLTLIDEANDDFTCELLALAKFCEIEVEVVDFSTFEDAQKFETWGDVVYWKNSTLQKRGSISAILNFLNTQNRLIINPGQLVYSELWDVNVQRLLFANYKSKSGDKKINLPLLSETFEEAKFLSFKVLCVGGKLLSVIDLQRNLDLLKEDSKFALRLGVVALKAASLFQLSVAEVIVVKDDSTGDIFFSHVQQVCEIDSYKQVSNIQLGELVLKFFKEFAQRKLANVHNLVKNYYFDNFDYLYGKKFHFAARTALWFDDSRSRSWLDSAREQYLNLENKISSTAKNDVYEDAIFDRNEELLREPYLIKYPELNKYNAMLFKVLFAHSVYGVDLRVEVGEVLPVQELIDVKNRLEKDSEAMAVLSTYALNFMYNLDFLLRDDKEFQLHPDKLLKIGLEEYANNAKLRDKINLQIYFFTHCIINASRFYSQKINEHQIIYLKMLRALEEIVAKNYTKLNLDNKLEFILCCRLLDYKSILEDIVQSEAEQSLSGQGNYLVDMHNTVAYMKNKNDFMQSEHRNILYIMAYGKGLLFNKIA